jgi:chromosome segregation ATPase
VDTDLMYGLEVNRGGATVIFAGLPVATLPEDRLAGIRDELREILPDYHDAEEIPTIEGHFERKHRETQAELAAVRREHGETQAELTAVRRELAAVRRELDEALAGMRPESGEPSRKRARGRGGLT